MESTGIYWRPVPNVLEDAVHVVLVNAGDIKNVPGRKTDIGDSMWLAGLLRHGLLRGSFIPFKEVREWRDLTRLRKKYVQTVGDYKKRTHKLFESANIKIDSVVSDLFGVTGRNLMNLLVSDRKSFKSHIRHLMKAQKSLLDRIKKAAGIADVSSCEILAEIGPDMTAFPTGEAIVSWAGLCPGNNESAGKQKSGKSPVRKHHLKTIMTEVAWVAVKKRAHTSKTSITGSRHAGLPRKRLLPLLTGFCSGFIMSSRMVLSSGILERII